MPPFKKSNAPKSSRPAGRFSQGRFGKSFMSRKKVCRFCVERTDYVDFKNVSLLRNFITDRGKMLSSRTTGVCTFHQRGLAEALKRARNIALIPFAAAG